MRGSSVARGGEAVHAAHGHEGAGSANQLWTRSAFGNEDAWFALKCKANAIRTPPPGDENAIVGPALEITRAASIRPGRWAAYT